MKNYREKENLKMQLLLDSKLNFRLSEVELLLITGAVTIGGIEYHLEDLGNEWLVTERHDNQFYEYRYS